MNNISIFLGSGSKSHTLIEFGTWLSNGFYGDLFSSFQLIELLKASLSTNKFLCSSESHIFRELCL